MRKITLCLLLLAAVSAASGCSSARQFVPLPDQDKQVATRGMARLYVMTPGMSVVAVPMQILDGEKEIGKTGPRGFLCWERKPGTAEIVGSAGDEIEIEVEAKKGEVYYIQQKGFLFIGKRFELIEEDDAEDIMEKCKPPKVELDD
ncbi:hypothetical protein ACFL1X_06170 [Candidatus Hydrogenedentota bacterium]